MCKGLAAAEKVLDDVKMFLDPIYAEGVKSLQEAGEDLLALHRLNVPSPLHLSLLSTNAIEKSCLKLVVRLVA